MKHPGQKWLGCFVFGQVLKKVSMKRRSKIVVVVASVLGCSLATLLIVNERNHCPLKAYLPEDAELVSCEYQGFIDFSTMIEAVGPPEVKDGFTDRILASSPELQFVATGNAGWHDGVSWAEESSDPAPFNFYQERTDQRLAIGYQNGLLTVIYDSW
ncbi:hypothetical protein [Aliiroseovarius sp. F20344]|uniref:hypothetical protein n=1 Tax=Aliiroseovarius sp. F20344 TaxID=2926414 RepID=UPI001FF64998|nr:hypothetical protein [Aliiroseovarius sp. F20344]MCK0142551.1 hypothetical protein [Aliiroseovarius sp. F20344]